ncbi:Asp-tRNA(Asn)/Glu-tRNA(Gln) amidotransferase subunit GatA [Mariniblastus fucicola]|uniref:Glutamyl-tRNA(Gln) amidotransferase subunit A n=1 Tax=Mariniblastus fucicola TaxID=980251 RepID=A0A5B9PC30_9BACT|nr:Asp-tRNA(Asn)/Glu-tRNA(Gln) amidotransferase subunit GatA [Mariniblastus fucicola]QEG23868.1 Glutamyl-tRNA(Gln) amidotransferase subunit A [Mariniblastus fucicola]
MSVLDNSIEQLVQQVSAGEVTASQCVDESISQLKAQNPTLNAFVSDCEEAARAEAAAMDAKIAAGENVGPLAGVPIAIKDGICTKGQRTTAGSKMLENFVPPYDATIVQRLRAAGAICIGKANLDEFAMGSSTENSFFGVTKNPWSADCVAGGSSGGSAAAVAAGISPASIGSDTGGSIRQPASFCGITGVKPTYGRVSRYGLIAFASSLDQIGPMARSAKDCAILMNVLSGHDAKDSTSARNDVPDFVADCDQNLKGLRIGICKQYFENEPDGSGLNENVRSGVMAAIEQLKELGAETVEIDLPHTRYAVPTYYVVAPCEASSNLSRFDGVRYTSREQAKDLIGMYSKTRKVNFGDEVIRRILLGTYSLSSGYDHELYKKASQVRRLIKNDYDAAFEKVDLIAGPTVPTTAFKIGEHAKDPLAMYLADVFTASANLAGVPGISLPCGFSADDGLPIGLQLQANMFGESTLFRAAHQYQTQTDWHLKRPQSS